MARIREFKPETVIDAALDLFWRNGYKACSMADVVKKSGVARYGLYQAFKDKDQLYCACLKRYRDRIRTLLAATFLGQNKTADYNTLVEHFYFIISQLELGQHNGCFAHQAAIERGGKDQDVDHIVQSIFKDVNDGYRRCIENGIKQGQIRDLPVDELVIYVMGIQRAVIAMSKQKCTIEERKDYIHCALQLLKP